MAASAGYNDLFGPDPKSVGEVFCIHCSDHYPECEVVWRKGLWSCRNAGCNGAGVGNDLWRIGGYSLEDLEEMYGKHGEKP